MNKYKNDPDFGDYQYDSKVEAQLDAADDAHTEWLEGLSDFQTRTRHFLLDRKGIPGVRHWFDSEVEDQEGRLDPETGYFYYQDSDGHYRHLAAIKTDSYTPRWALCGNEGILGEIILRKEDTNTETVVE